MIISDYTFSSDTGTYPFYDLMEADLLAEKFFHTANDPEQLKICVKNDKRIYKKFPECENVIKYKGKIIGETFILPCVSSVMKSFLKGTMSEAELFEYVMKHVTYENFDCIYLCLADIDAQHHGKWLATNWWLKTIIPLIKKNPNIVLFGWCFSKEGDNLLKSTAKILKLPLLLRKHI